jgi:hypothetical protein
MKCEAMINIMPIFIAMGTWFNGVKVGSYGLQ